LKQAFEKYTRVKRASCASRGYLRLYLHLWSASAIRVSDYCTVGDYRDCAKKTLVALRMQPVT